MKSEAGVASLHRARHAGTHTQRPQRGLRRCLQGALVTALAEAVLKQRAGAARAGEFGHHVGTLRRVGDLSGQSLPVMRRELVCGFPTVSWSADSKGDRGGVAEGRLAETVGTFPLHAEQRAGSQ